MMGSERRPVGSVLTLEDHRLYGAVGAVVCDVGTKRHAATAFLVGRFDVAVTVAHVFRGDGAWAHPDSCVFANAGPSGQIRELIPLLSIKTQWQLEPDTYARPTADLAVVRLNAPVRRAMRTLALTRFAHDGAPAVLVGYLADVTADARKRKTRGTVYRRPSSGCVRFTHDIDSWNVAAGAPIIDARDSVVIGIHTRLSALPDTMSACRFRGNAMIPMNTWLERTLRAEIGSDTLAPEQPVSPAPAARSTP